MSLLSVKNLNCSQNIKVLFENATFAIDNNDKVAIIGQNGSGKTTLLSQLVKSAQTSNTQIAVKKGLRITYLPQKITFDPKNTITDHLFGSNTPAAKAISKYQKCLHKFNEDTSNEAELALTLATEEMDHVNAWEYEARVNSILRELDITYLSQKMKELSGGMQKKIALAQAFFEETDILILDEPTNHLDITTIEWLEGMLIRQNSAVIMVTHDRYFLEKVCTKILEIDQQKLFIYKGNYQTYLEQRDARYASQQKQEQSIQSVLRVELAWLKRGPKARSTKQKARKQRIDGLLSRDKASTEDSISLNTTYRRLGKKVLDLKKICKSYDNQTIIKDFSHSFQKGERIGIIGANGAGKTTLLNLMAEKIEPDSGFVDVGTNTVFGYFDQHSQVFDLNMSIHKHVCQIGTQITCHDGTTISAAKLLEQFLFPSGMLKTPIGKLSGGERRRLHLVCLLLKNPNFLLFDEPTNDLDILTLSVLEDFLMSFAGCVIIISHDRYFMDRIVGQLFVFKDNGKVDPFIGNYTDHVYKCKTQQSLSNKKQAASQVTPDQKKAKQEPQKRKLTHREKQELSSLEKEIDTLESEKEKLSSVFSSSTSTPEDYEATGKRLGKIDQQLKKNLARWETLAELS
jgi:ABC transport system ATP-binding/permease protein